MAVDVQSGYTKLEEPVKEAEEVLGDSQIAKVFAGSTILVTGGTGFLGRLLVEKLLRSCPDVKKVYLLARPKKNKDINERIREQFNDVLYDRLRKERPDFLDQIGLVEGDIGELNVGLSEESRAKLANEVDIIFHGAATVRFDEALPIAVNINVRGAREMLLLARACPRLRAYIHVSTAYSNCNLKEIEERFYESPIDAEKLITLTDNIDANTLSKITPMLLNGFPNTYAFTKAAAEDIVKKYSKGLPVVVYRPSIVISTAKEPVPGWINNVYGPTGVVVSAAVGLMHVLHCNPKAVADLVPGDMVVNCAIAAAWRMARDFPRNEEAPTVDQAPAVYNFVSSVDKPLLWENFMKISEVNGLPIPPANAIWYYSLILTNSKILYELLFFFLHWVPAYIVDGIAILLGKKPMLRSTYTKLEKYLNVLSYFGKRDWVFHNDGTRSLIHEMNETDRQVFDFDISKLDWNRYAVNYMSGVRLYVIKESVDTIDEGIRKQRWLKLAHYFVLTVLVVMMLQFVYLVLRFLF
ncbi:fatty acyl-CoA reductase wat-like isoform X2 [Aricia agestis]|uniref:fatty acyl-CoA reductase wat-like isoform X2 n=1 Tax=Aricia agestis TaxID=91739 RepID=UPI001C20547D|nr:fatty acyl-CoA reductase wat-like isoform X2 [Aricia agestis]